VLLPARILRDRISAPAKLPRTVEEDAVRLVVLDVRGGDAHAGADAVERGLELSGGEEREIVA